MGAPHSTVHFPHHAVRAKSGRLPNLDDLLELIVVDARQRGPRLRSDTELQGRAVSGAYMPRALGPASADCQRRPVLAGRYGCFWDGGPDGPAPCPMPTWTRSDGFSSVRLPGWRPAVAYMRTPYGCVAHVQQRHRAGRSGRYVVRCSPVVAFRSMSSAARGERTAMGGSGMSRRSRSPLTNASAASA